MPRKHKIHIIHPYKTTTYCGIPLGEAYKRSTQPQKPVCLNCAKKLQKELDTIQRQLINSTGQENDGPGN